MAGSTKKYARINGSYVSDGAPITNYLVKLEPYEEDGDQDEDDDIFFYFQNEEELKSFMKPNNNEFIVSSYELCDAN